MKSSLAMLFILLSSAGYAGGDLEVIGKCRWTGYQNDTSIEVGQVVTLFLATSDLKQWSDESLLHEGNGVLFTHTAAAEKVDDLLKRDLEPVNQDAVVNAWIRGGLFERKVPAAIQWESSVTGRLDIEYVGYSLFQKLGKPFTSSGQVNQTSSVYPSCVFWR